jgi:hypothetical protein
MQNKKGTRTMFKCKLQNAKARSMFNLIIGGRDAEF